MTTPTNAASAPVWSLSRFAQTIKLGERDHIFLGPLKALHGSEKHTRAGWQAVLEQLKAQPAKRG